MIQPNELRIGNWVQRPEDIRNSIIDGDRIYFPIDHTMIRDCEYYKENWAFEGIHLTPEILEKCGFVRVSIGYNYPGSVFSLYQSNNPNRQNILPCWNEQICSDVPVKYLHQLQNIFHSLTGTELPINPLTQ